MSEMMEKQTEKLTTKPPKMWAVIMLNDDFTTFEFVSECLREVFKKSDGEAFQITKTIHESGKGVCGVYTKDIAATKQAFAMEIAKKYGYPLLLELEEK